MSTSISSFDPSVPTSSPQIYIYICAVCVVLWCMVRFVNPYWITPYINAFYSLFCPDTSIFNTENIPSCKLLRENWITIRDEYREYTKHYGDRVRSFREVDPEQNGIDVSDIDWPVVFLRVYDNQTDLAEYFPKTSRLLSQIPECSLAMFSVLQPGKRIPPHRGPYRGVLRYHLALETDPDNPDDCFIFIDNQKYTWRAGQDILFDDTYIHHVTNNTNTTRVVLFLDLKRTFNNPIADFLNTIVMYISRNNPTVTTIVNNTNDTH